MNKILNKSVFMLTTLMAICATAFAQESSMADALRQDGKIWVVVGVITIILLGLFAYLIWLERRLAKLEKKKK